MGSTQSDLNIGEVRQQAFDSCLEAHRAGKDVNAHEFPGNPFSAMDEPDAHMEWRFGNSMFIYQKTVGQIK